MNQVGRDTTPAGTALIKKNSIGDLVKRSSHVFVLVGLFIFMSVASEYFFMPDNLLNILRQSAVVGIIALGQTFVIITGGIDLSVGANMALSGCVMAVAATTWALHPVLAVLIGILVALAVGLLNGFLITRFKLQDFIATLGVMTMVEGIALLVTDGLPISGIPEEMFMFGNGDIGNFPIAILVLVAVVIISYVLLNHTPLGRNIMALGGNKEAARVSGINVNKTKILATAFSGLCCGIAGMVMIGRLNSANALMGTSFELNSIAAVVLGGTSINGGSGSIIGTVIGVITMGILSNGLDLLAVTAFWQKVILGIVIILVVTLDTFRRERLSQA